MARKGQVSIQDTIETDEEFDAYLEAHQEQLICMEVYSEYCGFCLATGNAIRKGKLEIGQDRIAMVKAPSDKIDILSRFKYKSEPVFLFIMHGKLTRAMFGANGIELCRIIEEELGMMQREIDTGVERPKFEIGETLPEEAEKLEEELRIEQEYSEAVERLRTLTLAARKKRVSERMAKHLRFLNFIMFWPHCHQAHYDLYEKWDMISVNVAAKETFQLTKEMAMEALYMSDVDPNEACIHALLSGEVLVVLFKFFETDTRDFVSEYEQALYMSDVDPNEACIHALLSGEVLVMFFKFFETDTRDFVKIMRYALYEEIPIPKEDTPPEKQIPPIPAYERYATISKTAREVRRDRYNAKMEKLRKEKEERDRLAAEQARMAREAEEERQRELKQKADEERMARIAAGLPPDPKPEPVEVGEEGVEGEGTEKADTDAAETVATDATEEPVEDADEAENVEVEEEFHSDVSVEGEEYIPPGGLFVPGLYSPPNEMAKANGLKLFFPKVVTTITPIETEMLPPHVLIMFGVDKRHEVREVINMFPDEIINVGIFVGDEPHVAEHVAYTIKQYDKMTRIMKHKDRLALMVSRKRSLPILHLAAFNPCYISSDAAAGERDCLTMFPVGYGDDYVEEESVHEEEVPEVAVEPEPEPEVVQEQIVEEEDEED